MLNSNAVIINATNAANIQ